MKDTSLETVQHAQVHMCRVCTSKYTHMYTCPANIVSMLDIGNHHHACDDSVNGLRAVSKIVTQTCCKKGRLGLKLQSTSRVSSAGAEENRAWI